MRLRILISLSLLFSFLSPMLAHAQIQEAQERPAFITDTFFEEYKKPTIQNLSKTYWALGAYKPANENGEVEDYLIDNFMRINECDLYKQYYSDDFEWQEIRKTMKGFIKSEAETYSKKLKFILPIEISRYDHDEKGFVLPTQSQQINVQKIEISASRSSEKICGKSGSIEGYPRSILLMLNKPFTYRIAPVDPYIAQNFLRVAKKTRANFGYDSNRQAWMRVRVTILRHHGTTTAKDGSPAAVLYGYIDGIDVFQTEDEQMMISQKNMR